MNIITHHNYVYIYIYKQMKKYLKCEIQCLHVTLFIKKKKLNKKKLISVMYSGPKKCVFKYISIRM